MLADDGWLVRFVGVYSIGSEKLRFPPHPNITVKILPSSRAGLRQKISYIRFMLLGIRTAIFWRPDWIYASDLLASPVALILAKLFGIKTIYHEHDSPASPVASAPLTRLALKARTALARISKLNVLPQLKRLDLFVKATSTLRPTVCVWNCPARLEAEAVVHRERSSDQALGIYFHGSINLERLPLTLIEGAALSGVPVRLRIVGYETIGSQGATTKLIAEAEKAGPLVKLEIIGPVARHLLKDQMKEMHVGWINCLNPADDVNLRHFVGASVKAFDYLAACLPFIAADEVDWRNFYLVPGLARTCNASDAVSIAKCIRWFYDHPGEAAQMGVRGRDYIRRVWNYETQFAPVLAILNRV